MSAPEVLQAFRDESRSWHVERDGWRIAGRTWGDGPPLYFLNPLGVTHELYALLGWLLKDDFRCVLFDYAEGTTRRTRRQARLPGDLADDLFATADRHGDDGFSVFGASFGSLVALTAMHERPGRIERAVLQGGFAHRPLAAFERLMIRAGRFLPGTLRNVPGWLALQRHGQRTWFPPFDTGRWSFYLEDAGAAPVSRVASQAAALRHFDLRAGLREIGQPVLLLRPEGEGRVGARCADELQSGLPGVQCESLPNCGPLAFLTHPHRLAKLIREFS